MTGNASRAVSGGFLGSFCAMATKSCFTFFAFLAEVSKCKMLFSFEYADASSSSTW